MLYFHTILVAWLFLLLSCRAEHWIIHEAGFNDDAKPERTDVEEYTRSMRNFKNRGSDGEHLDAMHQFFYSKLNGTVLELGAVDGIRNSESRSFVPLGWRRILIEADPKHRDSLANYKSKTFSVNAAICNDSKSLHYIRKNLIGGIIEYFSEGQLKREFPQLLHYRSDRTGAWDWKRVQRDKEKLPEIVRIACLPLATVLKRAAVRHIDFFVLDTEGAELSVLRSIDFSQVTFDVIVVETETLHGFRSSDFLPRVTKFLKPKGYSPSYSVCGRNTWFIRNGFKPSTAPFAEKGCFRGAIAACRMRALDKEAEKFEKHCTTTTTN